MPFEELLAEVDRLAGAGYFAEDVVCQSGQSTYAMAHAKQFIGTDIGAFAEMIASSSVVISHGGATVVQLLLARKPFVAFPNPRGAGDHQASFLRRIAAVADISWSPHVADLAGLIRERLTKGPASVQLDFPRIHTEILRFVGQIRLP
jgi:UDP-N-acetylglucosamine transferase subunit ALG13